MIEVLNFAVVWAFASLALLSFLIAEVSFKERQVAEFLVGVVGFGFWVVLLVLSVTTLASSVWAGVGT